MPNSSEVRPIALGLALPLRGNHARSSCETVCLIKLEIPGATLVLTPKGTFNSSRVNIAGACPLK